MSKLQKNIEYQELVDRIGEVYQAAKKKVVSAVNTEMLYAYWEIGKYIIEYEQGGKLKAEYGKALLLNLSKDLSIRYGRGFSRSNLQYMRLLYQYYPICQTLSGKLSWSHYVELVSIDDNLARAFYERQAILEDWRLEQSTNFNMPYAGILKSAPTFYDIK